MSLAPIYDLKTRQNLFLNGIMKSKLPQSTKQDALGPTWGSAQLAVHISSFLSDLVLPTGLYTLLKEGVSSVLLPFACFNNWCIWDRDPDTELPSTGSLPNAWSHCSWALSNWNYKLEPESNPDSLIWDAGILISILMILPNTHSCITFRQE